MNSHAERLSIAQVDPAANQAVLAMEQYVRAGDLEPALLELVRIRASQINGCAFCLDMHQRDARANGEDQRRLHVLPGWHEVSDLFTSRERAAMLLTETVTRIADGGVPDDVWDQVSKEFNEAETVRLLMAIATINVWNRLAVSTHQQPPTNP
ncbi:MAG: carboxymuconolactone decarboxylase family protein [Nocardioidaceae bacterium]